MESPKPMLKSRTIWFHLISVAYLGLVCALIGKTYAQGDAPSTVLKLSPFLVPVVGIVMRFLTTGPVKLGVMLLIATALAPVGAEAKQPTAVLRVTINGEAYTLPDPADRKTKPIKCVAGDDVIFDLSASEGEPDRFFVTIDNRKPGTQPLTKLESSSKVRLQTHAGAKVLRFNVSNPDGFDEWEQPVVVLCKAPDIPDDGGSDGGEEPMPTPTPIPPRPDNPPAPKPTPPVNGEYRLAEPVYKILMDVKSPNLNEEAAKLADTLKTIAKDIRPVASGGNGTITNAAKLLTAYKNDFTKIAPDNTEWANARNRIGDELNRAYQAAAGGKLAVDSFGELKNPAAWADLIDECERGARAVRIAK